MHWEEFEVGADAAEAINAAKRLVLVGTTTLRVMESLPPGPMRAGAGSTDIFVRPGFDFQRTGALLTNFHLPKSTLFVLVCALAGSGLMREAYAQAVRERYRFFSYGDCMLIL
jgi:S-adenosylmethionine:tRNA ribosyltransferase-isomerase